MKLLHCMGKREHLESALRDGLMLTDHEVHFAPTEDVNALATLLNQILPLLKAKLLKLGQPLESISEERRKVLFGGLGHMRGKVPMLCLTEVPAGRIIDTHRYLFGSYGMVISRDWVERNGGDRVLYVGHSSLVSRQLFISLATMRIFGLLVDSNSQVLFDIESMRPAIDLLSYFEVRDHVEEAEWRITGNHGFMGGIRETGKRLPIKLEDIEYVFVPNDSEVKELSSVVDELANNQGSKSNPKVMPFPSRIPFYSCMPAKDIYYDSLKNALIKDGWIITHDPLRLKWGVKDMYVDLGTEQLVTAEKAGRKIAVEIKSFVGASELRDLENAIGQHFVYRSVMARTEPDRTLYLAVHREVFLDVFEEPLGSLLIEDYRVPLVIFDSETEEVIKWIP